MTTDLRTCSGDKCRRAVATYAAGQWWCERHVPSGSTCCTHSLASDGRCSYCGGPA